MTTHADGTPPAAFPGSYPPAAPPAAPVSPPPADQSPVLRAVRSAAAGRRTSRRGMIISVLVVLLGGMIAFAASQVLIKHTEVLAVAQDVTVGATITDADLTTASVVKDPNLSPIPSSDRSQIVGMIAQVGLVKGSLLTRAQVGSGSGFTAGQQLVALPLKPGQFPARGLSPGQKVLIVATPGQNGSNPGGSTATGSAGSGASSAGPSSINGIVVDVGAMSAATQVTVIDMKVDAADGVQVAQLASTGNLALILLPAGR
jgi:hypothetical protein